MLSIEQKARACACLTLLKFGHLSVEKLNGFNVNIQHFLCVQRIILEWVGIKSLQTKRMAYQRKFCAQLLFLVIRLVNEYWQSVLEMDVLFIYLFRT